MSDKPTGGSAFPVPFAFRPSDGVPFSSTEFTGEGLTIRDYFAAKAMQGWLASYTNVEYHPATSLDAKNHLKNIANDAYAVADAMMRARDQ